jgi:hypothetical protein
MPRLDSKCDVIGRIVGIERGPVPQMSNTPKYLVIRAVTPLGSVEVLISESAAAELAARLKDILPIVDSE